MTQKLFDFESVLF